MNSQHRHLAAILFTGMPVASSPEIQGGTWLQDKAYFHKTLRTCHETHGGRIVNYFGHGSISLFGCTLDAVRCARMIQQKLRAHGLNTVRMGIHLGEVMDEIEDISGTCVNITSRVLDLGVPGSVIFTDIVHAQIRNQPEFKIKSLGKFALKNIAGKVGAYALIDRQLVVPSRQDALKAQRATISSHWLFTPVEAIVFFFTVLRLVFS